MDKKSTKKKLAVILGMHRSGTSALTRSLEVLGYDLGERLMPGAENNNEKGFFEDIDFNQMNVQVQKTFALDWDSLKPPKFDFRTRACKQLVARATDLLHLKLDNSPSQLVGVKDPRVTVLLPFWLEVFKHCDFETDFVFSVRNPLSIADSLSARDGFTRTRALSIWLRYVTSGLAELRGHRCIFVEYERLVLNPDEQLKRLSKYLSSPISVKALSDFKTEFLDAGLSHYNHVSFGTKLSINPIVESTYGLLQELSLDELEIESKDANSKINDILAAIEAMQDEFEFEERRAWLEDRSMYWRERGRLIEELGSTKALAEELSKSKRQAEEIVQATQTEASTRQMAIEELRSQLENATANNHSLEALKQALFVEKVQLDTRFDVQNGQLEEVVRQLESERALRNEVEVESAAKDVRLSNQSDKLAHLEQRLNDTILEAKLLSDEKTQLEEVVKIKSEELLQKDGMVASCVNEISLKDAGLTRAMEQLRLVEEQLTTQNSVFRELSDVSRQRESDYEDKLSKLEAELGQFAELQVTLRESNELFENTKEQLRKREQLLLESFTEIEERETKVRELRSLVKANEVRSDQREVFLAELLSSQQKLQVEVQDQVEQLAAKNREIEIIVAERKSEIDQMVSTLNHALHQRDELARVNHALVNSTSFRVTRPLRTFATACPTLTRGALIFTKFVWWTVTFQLFRRLSSRRV